MFQVCVATCVYVFPEDSAVWSDFFFSARRLSIIIDKHRAGPTKIGLHGHARVTAVIYEWEATGVCVCCCCFSSKELEN